MMRSNYTNRLTNSFTSKEANYDCPTCDADLREIERGAFRCYSCGRPHQERLETDREAEAEVPV